MIRPLVCIAALLLPVPFAFANCSLLPGLPESTPDSRFQRSEPISDEPVVEDLLTGLVWQGCESGRSGGDCSQGSAIQRDWSGALQYAAGADYGGFSDWRLPNARELASLIETGCAAPALNTTIFPVDVGAPVWSGSAAVQSAAVQPGELPEFINAWLVNFATGERIVATKASSRRVRLVRAGRGLASFDAGADFTPDPIDLAVLRAQPLAQIIDFGPLSVSGVDTPVGVAIEGEGAPQYSINGGAFTDLPGSLVAGDVVRVRHLSAATPGTQVSSLLKLGPLRIDAQSVTASDNADLAALALDQGSLVPAFAPSTQSYSATVTNAVSSVRVTATLDDVAASLQIAGAAAASGVASPPLPLVPGDNTIPVEVLAEDGLGARSYSIAVHRTLASSIVTLQSNADSVLPGDPLTLTAVVVGDLPTGSVSFLANGQAVEGCAAQTLSTGTVRLAECTTNALPTGEVLVRAEYSGDARNLASSGQLLQTVNTPPVLTVVSSVSIDEDAALPLEILVQDAESPAADLQLSLSAAPASLFDSAALAAALSGTGSNRSLALAGRADAFGDGTLTLVLVDPQGGRSERFVAVEVRPVNDPPSASMPTFRAHPAGTSGAQSVSGFVTAQSVGVANEADQLLSFEVEELSDPNGVVDSTAIDPDGRLDYVLSGRSGVARVRVTPVDDGGIERGGVNRGEPSIVRLFVGPGSDIETRIERLLPAEADLPAAIAAGATSGEFRIRVVNHGPVALDSLQLAASARRGLTAVLWTCAAPSDCVPEAGSGTLSVTAGLGVAQQMEAALSADFVAADRFLLLEAAATAAPGLLLGRDDDRRVLIEPLHPSAIFQNGFE